MKSDLSVCIIRRIKKFRRIVNDPLLSEEDGDGLAQYMVSSAGEFILPVACGECEHSCKMETRTHGSCLINSQMIQEGQQRWIEI